MIAASENRLRANGKASLGKGMIHTLNGESKALRSRVLSGSFVLLAGSVLVSALNFIYNVAMARFLGPIGFGHATAVYTLLVLLSAITLSFQIVSAKVVAQQSSPEARSAAYRGFHQSAWATGVVVGMLVLGFRNVICEYLKLPSPILIVLLAIGATFYIPLGSRRGYLLGVCGFSRLAVNLILEGFIRLSGSLLLVALGFGVAGVIGANAAAVAVAYLFVMTGMSLPSGGKLRVPHAFREALQAIAFFIGQVIINNCDIVLVKHFFPPAPAGIYAAVALVGRVIFAFSWAVVNTMFPIVAGARSEQRRDHSVLGTSLLLVFGIGSLAAFALRLMSPAFWALLFGPQFVVVGKYGLPYLLATYAATTCIYSLSVVVIAYEMAYKLANTAWVQLAFSGVLIAAICLFHSSLQQVIWVQLVMMLLLLCFVAAPFLRNVLAGFGESQAGSGTGGMQIIRPVSENEVIAEFLKTDFYGTEYESYRSSFSTLVASPNFENAEENARRRALLSLRHGSLWRQLPGETEWFEVKLTTSSLLQLRVFPRAQWSKLARGKYDITAVADRIAGDNGDGIGDAAFLARIQSLRNAPCDELNGAVILIGVSADGPFTILDGNHRLVAATLNSPEVMQNFRFYCGLSPRMVECCWYRTSVATLFHYGASILQHLVRDPRAELARILETPLPVAPNPAPTISDVSGGVQQASPLSTGETG